jgi:pimeloyl-ACP methyl ester carboxylesterase
VKGRVAILVLLLTGCRSIDPSPAPPPREERTDDGLFVRQSGAGPDVVLLHGLGDSSVGWRRIEPALVEAGFRVTVWDALGAGQSEKPAHGDYRLEAHLARLERTLAWFGVGRAAVVGHSLGGSLALMFAQRHPDRVRALALIDAAAYRQGALEDRRFWDVPLLADIVLGLITDEFLVDFGLRQNFHHPERISEELRAIYLREARRPGAVRALILQERQLMPDDPAAWEAGHRTVAAPTLILWGEHDRLVPRAQGERLAREMPRARLVVLADLAHSPQLEAPERVLERLIPFLKDPGCRP